MITIYSLKPAFQKLLRPLVGKLADAGVTPNQVTAGALLLSVAMGMLISLYPHRWVLAAVPLFMLLRMALNAIDGMLAREHGKTSPAGALLNELGDLGSDAALYLPFALLPVLHPALVVMVVVLALIAEAMGIAVVHIGSKRRYDGPMGKSDRAFVFSVMSIVYACHVQLSVVYNVVCLIMIVLLVITAYNRMASALQEAK